MQVTLHVVLSFVSTAVCLGVAALLRERRHHAGATSLLVFTLAAALWAGGNTLQAASTTVVWKTLSLHVQYVAIAAVPVTWFAFAAEYTGHRWWLDRRVIILIAIPLAGLLLLEWTNGMHHLVRTHLAVQTIDGVAQIDRSFGPAFWLGVIYSNLILGAGTLLLFRGLVRTRRVYRMQVGLIIGGSLVPWFANLAYLRGSTPIEPEVFYAVTAVAFAVAVTRYQLFDLTPVARSTVLDELPDPVFVADHTNRIVDVNEGAAALTDRTEADLLGAPLEDVLPDSPAVATEPPPEIVRTGSDGKTRHFAPRVSPLPSDAGTIVLLRDVTQLAESRRELEHRNAQLEHVADVMSHDLRSPLNVAKGRLQLAMENVDDDAVLEDLETVARAHDRMDSIVDSTLRAARTTLKDADLERVSLTELCERARRTADADSAPVSCECGTASIEADPELLVTVLENLFRNATDHGDADEIVVETTDDGFAVTDDGVGLADADVERVLERGYTTSAQGTGLGLAIVADVADAHGWTVDIGESETGGVRVEFGDVDITRQPAESAPHSHRGT